MNIKKTSIILSACIVLWSSIDAFSHGQKNLSSIASQSAIIGSGDFTFKVDHDWLDKQGSKQLGATHGDIVFDKAGQLYISFSRGEFHGIAVFSAKGKFIRKLDGDYPNVHGMHLVEENGIEYIYAVSNSEGVMWKMDLMGKPKLVIDREKVIKDSGVYKPNNKGEVRVALTGVTTAPNGDIYLADGYASNYIHRYNQQGEHVQSFGGKGADLGKFHQAHDISVDTRYEKPYLIICNRANNRIEHYDFDGNFVRVISEGLRYPGKVDFWGEHLVVAELRGRVTVLDKQHNIVAHLGTNESKTKGKYRVKPELWEDGLFYAPHTARFDSLGNLFVMDWSAFGRVTKLQKLNL